ncbi:uncharacterized protein Fot_41329 [Forsythia ovata]|uniref:Uncharacterized protein n=1 Tax=Forsythia ovata TaxID=205694 RepID=A0ABD1RHY7_9LAMI
MSIKGAEGNTFQKNCVEFNLYEPRRDKTVKGQLLGTTVLDLAGYGVVKESLSVNAPIISKRTYRNTAQPLLFLKIQPFEKSRTSSFLRDSLTGEASKDRNHGESVYALMSEEYAEEAEVSMFTDDISSHSSLAASFVVESIGYSSPQDKENRYNSLISPKLSPGQPDVITDNGLDGLLLGTLLNSHKNVKALLGKKQSKIIFVCYILAEMELWSAFWDSQMDDELKASQLYQSLKITLQYVQLAFSPNTDLVLDSVTSPKFFSISFEDELAAHI